MKDKIIDEKVVVSIDTPEGRKFYENMKEELTPLEALNDLREVKGWNDNEFNKRLDIIEKSLKVLEIFKDKITDISFKYGGILGNVIFLKIGINTCYLHFDENDKNFDLLKEVLK
jgi:hypothetical protein